MAPSPFSHSTQEFLKRSRRAFTLLEILVVLTIIGMLVALAVTNYDTILNGQKINTAELFVKQSIKIPLVAYMRQVGDYPSTQEGLQALIAAPQGKEDRWRGPYLSESKLPRDPWGREYQYRYPGVHNKTGYDVWSLGPDGQESEDDIKNW